MTKHALVAGHRWTPRGISAPTAGVHTWEILREILLLRRSLSFSNAERLKNKCPTESSLGNANTAENTNRPATIAASTKNLVLIIPGSNALLGGSNEKSKDRRMPDQKLRDLHDPQSTTMAFVEQVTTTETGIAISGTNELTGEKLIIMVRWHVLNEFTSEISDGMRIAASRGLIKLIKRRPEHGD